MHRAEFLLALIPVSFDLRQSLEGVQGFEMVVSWMESALPVLQNWLPFIVYFWFTVLLPIYIFPRMRPLIVSSLRVSALLIGIVCWWQSFIVTYRMLGGLALIAGTLFAGVGVAPLALFATAKSDRGETFGEIMVTLVLMLAARFMARAIAGREARTKPVHVDDYEF
jgi:hypothetical protein